MPAKFGSLIGGAGSLVGGILGSGAANQAGAGVTAAAQQGNAGLQNIENQSTANLQPFIDTGQHANSALAGLLGIGGDPAASSAAFNNYLGSTNYQFQLNQGLNATKTAGAASFNSGATAKALNNYAQGQAGSALQGYEGQLSGLSGQGIGAAGTLGGLGNQNAGMQATNLLDAAGYAGNADIYGASAWTNAAKGLASGLSSFGGGSGGSALSGLFGGGGGSSGGAGAGTSYNPFSGGY